MMPLLINGLAAGLIIIGCGFFLAGSVGLLRLPDFYCRLHATTKCDIVGAVFILAGVGLISGLELDSVRILALIALIMTTSPTAGHALARAGWHAGYRPWVREDHDEPE